MFIDKTGFVSIGGATTAAPSARLHVIDTDTATAAVTNVLVLDHSTSGTPAASYGTGLAFKGQSSTTVSRDMGRFRFSWGTATDASRTVNFAVSTYNNSGTEVDLLNLNADGTGLLSPNIASFRIGATGLSLGNGGGATLSTFSSPGTLTVQPGFGLRTIFGGAANTFSQNGMTQVEVSGIYNATAGSTSLIMVNIKPEINQTAPAAQPYTALQINVTETNALAAAGSKLLADFQTGSVSKVKITSAGVLALSTIAPLADSTTALKLTKADGSTAVLTVDTTNGRVGIGVTPTQALDIVGSLQVSTNIFINGSGRFDNSSGGGTVNIATGSNGPVVIGTNNTANAVAIRGIITEVATDAATATVTNVLTVLHNSSGTPAAGFGTGLEFDGHSSTNTQRAMGHIRTIWTTATDASRNALMTFSAYNIGTEVDLLSLDPVNHRVTIDPAAGSSSSLAFRDTFAIIVRDSTSFRMAGAIGAPFEIYVTDAQPIQLRTSGTIQASIPAAGGVRVHSDPGSGAASTETFTNDVSGTPANTATVTKWLKVWDGTTARYLPLYT